VTDPDITLESLKRDFLSNRSLVGAQYLGRYQVVTTSGTTGDPAILVHDADSWAVDQAAGQRGELRFIARRRFLLGMARHGFRGAALFVTDEHISGSIALESARRTSSFLAKRVRMFSVLRSAGELVDELNDFQPTVLAGYPTALALMSAEQKAGRLTIKPLPAITAGEDQYRPGQHNSSAVRRSVKPRTESCCGRGSPTGRSTVSCDSHIFQVGLEVTGRSAAAARVPTVTPIASAEASNHESIDSPSSGCT
jgi:hypothetical protein